MSQGQASLLKGPVWAGISLMVLLLWSCNAKESNNNSHKLNNFKDTNGFVSATYVWPREKVDSLINCALKDNNHIAYSQVSSYFGMSGKKNQFFTISFQMANKNNCARAYYDLYLILLNDNSFSNSIQILDEKSKLFAIYCLLKAHELGYKCDYYLDEYFDLKKIPKSEVYLKKYHEY